jgi:hypothetical protein
VVAELLLARVHSVEALHIILTVLFDKDFILSSKIKTEFLKKSPSRRATG